MESPGSMITCSGGYCDTAMTCGNAGKCLYRSSAEEARDVLAAAHVTAITEEVRTRLPMQEFIRDNRPTVLPTDSSARKDIPLARGVLDYFPAALAAVAELSRKGNEKHNPGEELHWARGKSSDHADCILRHLVERGKIDTDGLSHSVKVAWRALALLQEELEATGAPLPRGAR